jgi:hypothetical protein
MWGTFHTARLLIARPPRSRHSSIGSGGVDGRRRNTAAAESFLPGLELSKEQAVANIREHMKIIGKDGAHVGTVDRIEGTRIKLTKKDSPAGHQDHHHFIDLQLVGAVEGDIVKLSVNADALPKFEQEQSGKKI